MRTMMTAGLGMAALVALAGCGGTPTQGENVEQAFDNAADYAENMADNATTDNAEATLEDSADALENAGDRAREAVDSGQANAQSLQNVL